MSEQRYGKSNPYSMEKTEPCYEGRYGEQRQITPGLKKSAKITSTR